MTSSLEKKELQKDSLVELAHKSSKTLAKNKQLHHTRQSFNRRLQSKFLANTTETPQKIVTVALLVIMVNLVYGIVKLRLVSGHDRH